MAVRHAPDHIHIMATLARQDGIRPTVWNDFRRVRDACQEAERWFGLRSTAAADRTAARRPTRAETEQAARRGWAAAPRATLRRKVAAAAGGASRDFPMGLRLDPATLAAASATSQASPGHRRDYQPPKRAGPGR